MIHAQRFVFRGATLPALASAVLLVPFREPRNLIEVLFLPLIVMISGMIWVQLGAWFAPPSPQIARTAPSLAFPAAALAMVLAVFQLALRPGVRFY
jgi:hypothetical protein